MTTKLNSSAFIRIFTFCVIETCSKSVSLFSVLPFVCFCLFSVSLCVCVGGGGGGGACVRACVCVCVLFEGIPYLEFASLED